MASPAYLPLVLFADNERNDDLTPDWSQLSDRQAASELGR